MWKFFTVSMNLWLGKKKQKTKNKTDVPIIKTYWFRKDRVGGSVADKWEYHESHIAKSSSSWS